MKKKEWICESCELQPCYEYGIRKPIVCAKKKRKYPKFKSKSKGEKEAKVNKNGKM